MKLIKLNYCAYRESTADKGYGHAHAYPEAAFVKLPAYLQFFHPQTNGCAISPCRATSNA